MHYDQYMFNVFFRKLYQLTNWNMNHNIFWYVQQSYTCEKHIVFICITLSVSNKIIKWKHTYNLCLVKITILDSKRKILTWTGIRISDPRSLAWHSTNWAILDSTGSNIPLENVNATISLSVSVLKLLKMAKGIRALLDTVMQALPQVGNLGLLFFLLFFIFAALGVELFGRLGELLITYYILNIFFNCKFKTYYFAAGKTMFLHIIMCIKHVNIF